MTEDQSIVGRRRIYYDQDDGETLLCSDSEEEMVDEEENIKEFVEAEDKIIRFVYFQFICIRVPFHTCFCLFSSAKDNITALLDVLVMCNVSRMTIKQLGSSDFVYDSLAQRMSRKPCEVKVSTCILPFLFYLISVSFSVLN